MDNSFSMVKGMDACILCHEYDILIKERQILRKLFGILRNLDKLFILIKERQILTNASDQPRFFPSSQVILSSQITSDLLSSLKSSSPLSSSPLSPLSSSPPPPPLSYLQFFASQVFLRGVTMGDDNLKTWVSDNLMSLLGYSQATVVQYIIGISKQASSSAEVFSKLEAFGFPSSTETQSFAQEIFGKVPRKASDGLNLYQKQEREAAVLARKQKTYQLLDADDDDGDDGAGGTENKSLIATASDRHKKRFRKKIESEEDEEDEVVKQVEEARRVKRRTSSYEDDDDDDDDSEAEQERLRDQREREQLERNIRERDAAGLLTEPKLKKKEEEEAVRRSNALEKNELDTLRKVSRQEYLKKREQKKLEEIRDDIEDEQYLFDGEKLTETEYHDLSTGCQKHMIRKEVLIRRRDFPWPCSVTGMAVLEIK
ncbi:pre-mRNA-splicing factor ATP-dependent RNA helicase [Salix suchowensis]|nr:pre-mRNA-splicing factor ATP-dependent RNA helicase [Salix suchowensis]